MRNRFPGSLNKDHIAAARQRTAGIVGALALGLMAIAFAQCGEIAQHWFARLLAVSPYAPFVMTPAMFAGVAAATRRWWPAARGSGIPQVMPAALEPGGQEHGPLLSIRTAVAKFGCTLAMLLAGGSVGREGPTVQISAALMVAVHRWLRVPLSAGMVIAGGAAGVAAAFNTPLAGVAFAIEELAAAFEQRVALTVMAVVMIAGLVSLGLTGDYVYFGAMNRALGFETMLMVSLLAGALGGLAGGTFARCLIASSQSAHPWLVCVRQRPVLLAAACGLVVAVIGWASGGLSWGTGYETTRRLLTGQAAPMGFGPAKLAATLATALSGAPGGIFAPSLSVGAGLGQMIATIFPGSSLGAIVLLGMVGYFTGVVRAPMTAVIIMMEMTADRTMILPLFATALIADTVSTLVCREKLYHALSRPFLTQAPQA